MSIVLVLERFTGLVVIPLMTNNFSIEDYAVWTQYNIFVGILVPIVTMGLMSANQKFLPRIKNDRTRREINLLTMVLISLSFIVISALMLTNSNTIIDHTIGVSGLGSLMVFAMLFLWSEIAFEYALSIVRAKNQINKAGAYILLKAVLRMVVLYFLAIYIDTMYLLIQYYSIVMLISIFLISCIALYGEISFSVTITHRKKVLMSQIMYYSFPILLTNLVIGLNGVLDRYIIVNYLGNVELSQYAIAFSVASVMAIGYSALNYTLLPYLSNEIASKSDGYKYKYIILIYLCTVLSFIFIAYLAVYGEVLVGLLASSEYLASRINMAIIATSVACIGLYYAVSYPILLLGMSKYLLIVYLQSAILHLIISILLVSEYSMTGVLIGAIVSQVVLLIRVYKESIRLISVKIPNHIMYSFKVNNMVLIGVILLIFTIAPMNIVFAVVTLVVTTSLFLYANKGLLAVMRT